jgi:hypothetical protein
MFKKRKTRFVRFVPELRIKTVWSISVDELHFWMPRYLFYGVAINWKQFLWKWQQHGYTDHSLANYRDFFFTLTSMYVCRASRRIYQTWFKGQHRLQDVFKFCFSLKRNDWVLSSKLHAKKIMIYRYKLECFLPTVDIWL